jgi:hypothetical protein
MIRSPRIVTELRSQGGARAGEPRLHGPDAAADDLGQLGLGQPFEIEEHDGARVDRQREQGGLDVLGHDAAKALELLVAAERIEGLGGDVAVVLDRRADGAPAGAPIERVKVSCTRSAASSSLPVRRRATR